MKTKLSERTKRLLRQTRASILAEKAAYDQSNWGGGGERQAFPSCGAVACLIGWTVFHAIRRLPAKKKRSIWRRYIKVAKKHGASGYFRSDWVEKLLGLSNEQINNLYWKENWPASYQGYADEDARNAAKRITRFIKTEGRQ